MKKLQEELKARDASMAAMAADVSKVEMYKTESAEARDKLKKREEELTKELDSLKASAQDASLQALYKQQDLRTKYEKQVSTLRDRLTDMEVEFDSLRAEHDNQEAEYKHKEQMLRTQHEQQKSDWEARLASVNAELLLVQETTTGNESLTDVMEARDKALSDKESLSSQLSSVMEQLSDAEQAKLLVDKKLKAQKEEIEQLSAQLETVQREREDKELELKQDVSSLRTAVATAASAAKAKVDSQIRELERDRDALQVKVKEQEQALEAANAKALASENQASLLAQEVAQLNVRYDTATKHHEDKERTRAKAESTWKERVQSLTVELASAQRGAAAAVALKGEADDLRKEVSALKKTAMDKDHKRKDRWYPLVFCACVCVCCFRLYLW